MSREPSVLQKKEEDALKKAIKRIAIQLELRTEQRVAEIAKHPDRKGFYKEKLKKVSNEQLFLMSQYLQIPDKSPGDFFRMMTGVTQLSSNEEYPQNVFKNVYSEALSARREKLKAAFIEASNGNLTLDFENKETEELILGLLFVRAIKTNTYQYREPDNKQLKEAVQNKKISNLPDDIQKYCDGEITYQDLLTAHTEEILGRPAAPQARVSGSAAAAAAAAAASSSTPAPRQQQWQQGSSASASYVSGSGLSVADLLKNIIDARQETAKALTKTEKSKTVFGNDCEVAENKKDDKIIEYTGKYKDGQGSEKKFTATLTVDVSEDAEGKKVKLTCQSRQLSYEQQFALIAEQAFQAQQKDRTILDKHNKESVTLLSISQRKGHDKAVGKYELKGALERKESKNHDLSEDEQSAIKAYFNAGFELVSYQKDGRTYTFSKEENKDVLEAAAAEVQQAAPVKDSRDQGSAAPAAAANSDNTEPQEMEERREPQKRLGL